MVSGRASAWQGPALNVLNTMQKGARYTLSVWVRMGVNEPAAQARLSVERRLGTTINYDQVVGNTNVSNGAWTQLAAGYTRERRGLPDRVRRDGQRQTVTQLWGGQHTAGGQGSTVTPMSWNSSIPANGSVEFGFLGSRGGAAPAVTNLTCS